MTGQGDWQYLRGSSHCISVTSELHTGSPSDGGSTLCSNGVIPIATALYMARFCVHGLDTVPSNAIELTSCLPVWIYEKFAFFHCSEWIAYLAYFEVVEGYQLCSLPPPSISSTAHFFDTQISFLQKEEPCKLLLSVLNRSNFFYKSPQICRSALCFNTYAHSRRVL